LSQLHFQVAAFSMENATNLATLSRSTSVVDNLKTLLSPTLNHAIFANAGILVAVLVLGWRRRFLPYMTVILAFVVGHFIFAGIGEFHQLWQVLPLSLMLLSEWREENAGAGTAGESSAGSVPAWATRETFPVLVPMTIVVMGLSTGVAAWRYCDIFENLQPDHQLPSELGTHIVKFKYDLATQYQLLRQEYAEAELELARISVTMQQLSNAVSHYQRALGLNTNSVPALNNLAWLRATAPDPGLRNGDEAVELAERACQLTQYKEAFLIGTLAAAYAEAGRFDDAVITAQKARAVALAQGQMVVAASIEPLLALYKSGQAYHQKAKPAP
jgi:tetratricopeptide (TPR) repeat protein